MQQMPVHDGGASCELDLEGARQRNLEFADVVERGLVSRERPERSVVRLTFKKEEGLEQDLRELARRESECCGFFTFHLYRSDGTIVLRVESPSDKTAYLDELYRATEPA